LSGRDVKIRFLSIRSGLISFADLLKFTRAGPNMMRLTGWTFFFAEYEAPDSVKDYLAALSPDDSPLGEEYRKFH
jgi:hypothetical protein